MKLYKLAIVMLMSIFGNYVHPEKRCSHNICEDAPTSSPETPAVTKYVLENGLTLLVRQTNTLQKVSIELWINAGSAQEELSTKGIAHLIEHMLFKGTERMSESDIKQIATKFSANFNAWTSYDFTRVFFKFPLPYWDIGLPILADWMCNCTFKQELLNSELKVVVQELKMDRDNSLRSLFNELVTAAFADHPYHYPIIGHKQDLFDVKVQKLRDFYKKHYIPNNAVVVVVGNVEPADVLKKVQENFNHIPGSPAYQQHKSYHNKDAIAKSVTLYRDIQKPLVSIAFNVPGASQKQSYTKAILQTLLSQEKTGRLYKKLVDEKQLIDDIECDCPELNDYDLLTISFEPFSSNDIDAITDIIQKELDAIALHGCNYDELKACIKDYESSFYRALESNERQALDIGRYYLATGDENYLYTRQVHDLELLNKNIQDFVKEYLRPSFMLKGIVLPQQAREKDVWLTLQRQSDEADSRILSQIKREVDVEPCKYIQSLSSSKHIRTAYPQPEKILLNNGLTVLYYASAHVPTISLALKLKADKTYERESSPGSFQAVHHMLIEGGTKNHSAEALAEKLRKHGIHYKLSDGSQTLTATMLSSEFAKACELLSEMIRQPAFNKKALPKVKLFMESAYKTFIDDEDAIARHVLMQALFKKHPKGRPQHVEPKIIKILSLDDILSTYNTLFSPRGACLALVGDLKSLAALKEMLETTFGQWKGPEVPDPKFPKPSPAQSERFIHYMNRDQVTLYFGGPSINRLHDDFPALFLYEVNLFNRLFKLRDKSGGAFYLFGGSLFHDISKEPGIWIFHTIVSRDQLDNGLSLLKNFIKDDIESFNDEDLEQAKETCSIELQQRYTTNASIAASFINTYRYGLPFDHHNRMLDAMKNLTLSDVKQAVKRVLNVNTMCTVCVGRIGEEDICTQEDAVQSQD